MGGRNKLLPQPAYCLSAGQLREYGRNAMKSTRRALLILTALLPLTVFVTSASWAQTKLEASVFSYDGKDFVRTKRP